jgi:hypothetical protein
MIFGNILDFECDYSTFNIMNPRYLNKDTPLGVDCGSREEDGLDTFISPLMLRDLELEGRSHEIGGADKLRCLDFFVFRTWGWAM